MQVSVHEYVCVSAGECMCRRVHVQVSANAGVHASARLVRVDGSAHQCRSMSVSAGECKVSVGAGECEYVSAGECECT